MDYINFINSIPEAFNSWGEDNIQPKDIRFQETLSKVRGMTTANVIQILNSAMKFVVEGEIYCEIGCYQGATLIGALIGNNHIQAYAADNFSEFDPSGENELTLTKNLKLFGLESQVNFFNSGFEEFFMGWLQAKYGQMTDESVDELLNCKIGVYFYDGAHDYRSQLMALLMVKPFLADQAVIIVDDSNWESVKQANWDFIVSHPEASMLQELYTPRDGHHTFWNGINIIAWDKQKNAFPELSKLEIPRQERLIRNIYGLHLKLISNPIKLVDN